MWSARSNGFRVTLGGSWQSVLAAGLLVTACSTALAQDYNTASPVETCLAANRNLSLGAPLPRTAALLNAGGPLKVVALGSSSTSGLWVLNRARTYPEVMRRELARIWPDLEFEVLNRGRVGDTITRTLARLSREVLSYDPDLVVWQLGTNDVVWGGKPEGLKAQMVQGVRMLKSSGAELVLMDLQYTPAVLASYDHSTMQTIIADTAREEHVGLFSRFELMRRSIKAGISPNALVAWDGLHNSADGYECIGKALARAIYAAAR
jgi:acyl-CoA thioesterase I